MFAYFDANQQKLISREFAVFIHFNVLLSLLYIFLYFIFVIMSGGCLIIDG